MDPTATPAPDAVVDPTATPEATAPAPDVVEAPPEAPVEAPPVAEAPAADAPAADAPEVDVVVEEVDPAVAQLLTDAANARAALEAGDFAAATAHALVGAVSVLGATIEADGLP